jgi:hypothetical protein
MRCVVLVSVGEEVGEDAGELPEVFLGAGLIGAFGSDVLGRLGVEGTVTLGVGSEGVEVFGTLGVDGSVGVLGRVVVEGSCGVVGRLGVVGTLSPKALP